MRKSGKQPDSAMRVAQQALQLAKAAVKAPEKKQFQLSSQTTNYLTGIVTAVSGISQGLTSATRVGDRVEVQRFRLRGKFYSLTPSDTTFRVALVRSVGGGVPAITDVFNSDDTQSMRNRSLDDLYSVLHEQTITLNASFLNGDLTGQVDWDLGLGLPIWYTGAGGTYERGGLYLLVINDIADAASSVDKPAIGDTGSIWRCETVYTDQ